MTTGRSSVEPITPEMKAAITPEVLAAIGQAVATCKVDRSFDIPGVANRSTDGKTVYVDKALPNPMKDGDGKAFDPDETLPWHELPEWFLMTKQGMSYEQAHSLATEMFERPQVESLGLNWAKYQEAFGGEIDANEKRGVTGPVPPDLDLEPYRQSGDAEHLAEIEAAMKAATSVKPKGFRLVAVDHDPFAGEAA